MKTKFYFLFVFLFCLFLFIGCSSYRSFWITCSNPECLQCKGDKTYRCATCFGKGNVPCANTDRCRSGECFSCKGSFWKKCSDCGADGMRNCGHDHHVDKKTGKQYTCTNPDCKSSSSNVEKKENIGNSEKQIYKVTSETLNVRSGPGITYDIIITIHKSALVQLINKENSEWWKIKYKDKTGFCASKYLIIVDN